LYGTLPEERLRADARRKGGEGLRTPGKRGNGTRSRKKLIVFREQIGLVINLEMGFQQGRDKRGGGGKN